MKLPPSYKKLPTKREAMPNAALPCLRRQSLTSIAANSMLRLQKWTSNTRLGEKTNDVAGMTGDLQLKGNILLEMGKPDEAKAAYERLLKMTSGLQSLSGDQRQRNALSSLQPDARGDC